MVFAQEEGYAGYRHEYYREDDHRMSIDTDTASFDVGLGEQLRFTGVLVQDAISGATPTGSPPQSQWPYRSYTSYFNQAYVPLFQAAVNNPNNLGLYNSGYFPNFQAYTNYIAKNNPQLRTQATNEANIAYKALTNNPNFHRNTVPLTYLHDLRNAFSFSAPLSIGKENFSQIITPQVSYSTESDYDSLGLALGYAAVLNKKNTTLNTGWSHDSDLVRDDTLIHFRPKASDDFIVGINQLLDPKSYITVDLGYGQEHGYLSDPYRGVLAMANFPQQNPSDASLIPENRPRFRNHESFYVDYTRYITLLQGSVDVDYRIFHDSYGILAHTIDAAWHQNLWRGLVLSPSFRYYNQTAARFYYIEVPDFDHLPTYYSSDYRLSELESFNFSIALSYRVLKYLEIDLSYSRYIMQGLDGATSQSAYPSANVYSVGGLIWF